MIVESEMPDICKKLDQLTLDVWNGVHGARADYKLTWQAAWLAGFKITCHKIKNECGQLVAVKHSFKAREAKQPGVDMNGKSFNVHCKNNISDLKIVDMRPAGFKTPKGYCTTNAMAQVLPISFEAIFKKQRRHGSGWNCAYAYRPILERYGYQKVSLPKKLATFKVADKLFSIKTPFLAQSAHHITCIDNRGQKPCVNDTWDSRRCKIKCIYVKRADADRAKRILLRDDL